MDALERIFGTVKPVIAMLHFPGLPGRPLHDAPAGRGQVRRRPRARPGGLQAAGFDGLLFCNEADYPYQLKVGPGDPCRDGRRHRHPALRAAGPVRGQHPVGRGRQPGLARATGASFIREVLTGVYESDLGMIEPRSAISPATGR